MSYISLLYIYIYINIYIYIFIYDIYNYKYKYIRNIYDIYISIKNIVIKYIFQLPVMCCIV